MEQFSLHPILLIIIFATLTEALIEFVFANVLAVKPYIKLITLMVGIVLAFYYQVNVFEGVLSLVHADPFFDYLLSGVLVSRCANYLNDLTDRLNRK